MPVFSYSQGSTPTIGPVPIAGALANPVGVSVVNFSIPAGVRRLTLVSSELAIGNNTTVRLGTASGIVTTEYRTASVYVGSYNGSLSSNTTTGLHVPKSLLQGACCMTFYRTNTNKWSTIGQNQESDEGIVLILTAGNIQLPSELTTFSFISTSTINSGSLQLFWEF